MTPDDYREAIKEIAAWLEPIRSHETNRAPYKRIIEARRIADRALASTTAALPPPESDSSGLGSASALEVEAGESLLETRARAIVEAHERVEKATREAFPNGQCSFDLEWIAATDDLRNQLRLSAVMVARAFLVASATKPEASPSPETLSYEDLRKRVTGGALRSKSAPLGDDQRSSSVEVDQP